MAFEDLLGTGFLPELDSRVSELRRRAADPIGNARHVEGGFAPAGREGDVQPQSMDDFINQIVQTRFGGQAGRTLKGVFGGQEFELLRGQARPVFRGGFVAGGDQFRGVGQLGEPGGREGALAQVTDEQRTQAQAGLSGQAASQDRLRTLLQAAILSSGGDPLAQREAVGKALLAFEGSEQKREQFESLQDTRKREREEDLALKREDMEARRKERETVRRERKESEQADVSREEVQRVRAFQAREINQGESFAVNFLRDKTREIREATQNILDPAERAARVKELTERFRTGVAENLKEYISRIRGGEKDVALFGIIRGFEGGVDIDQGRPGGGAAPPAGPADAAPGAPGSASGSLSQTLFGKTPAEVVFGNLRKRGKRRSGVRERLFTNVAGRSFGEPPNRLGDPTGTPDALGGLLTSEFRGGTELDDEGRPVPNVAAVGRPVRKQNPLTAPFASPLTDFSNTLANPLLGGGLLSAGTSGTTPAIKPAGVESIEINSLIDAVLAKGLFGASSLQGRVKDLFRLSQIRDPGGDIRSLIPNDQRVAVIRAIQKLDKSGANREDIAQFLREAMIGALRTVSQGPTPRPGEGAPAPQVR